jgi:hypothetical protein
MQKVDFNETCEKYKLNYTQFAKAIKKGAKIPKTCATCLNLLFASCWVEEAEKRDMVVLQALEGSIYAKNLLHERLEKEA